METVAWLVKNIGTVALLSVLTVLTIQWAVTVDLADLHANLVSLTNWNPFLAGPASKLTAVADSL